MAKANITLRILYHLLSTRRVCDCSDHQCLRYRVHFLDKASGDLFIYAKYLFVGATAGPQTLGPKAQPRRMNEPVTLCCGGGHAGLAWALFVYPRYRKI